LLFRYFVTGARVDVPRTTITIAGTRPVRLSVIDVGPTKMPARGTIICIHGAGGNAEQWKNQIAYFSQHYRVLAPDLRGHDQSEQPRSSYTLEEFLWDFSQMLEQLAIAEPFFMLAHSFGGPIGLTFAAAQPQRVRKLVLVATAPEMHLNPLLEIMLKLPLPLHTLERLRPILLPRVYAPLFVLQRVLAGTLFPWRGWHLLASIQTPALIIGGQFDFIAPAAVLQRMRDGLPNARFELIRYAGHLPQIERPDAVNRAIEGFIERRRSWRGEEEELRVEN
jgi:pimeloyl-ACP methyl ester carboxylesterase